MPQTQNKGAFNRPMGEGEKLRFMKVAGALIGLSLVVMGVVFLLVHYDAIRLYPEKQDAGMLGQFAQKIEYAIRYQTLHVAWLLFNVLATIYGRFTNDALNPMYGESEARVQMHKNILTNSFEQATLSVLAQFVFVAFASPESVLKYIPFINIIQFIGRITFFIGYPLRRSFGMQCTLFPTIVLVFVDIIYFLNFLFGK